MSVVYEKHYPHPTLEEEIKEYEEYKKELEKDPEHKAELERIFNKVYHDMMEYRTLSPLPDKIEKADEFIKLAIEASEIYELDAKIIREDSRISVNYSFDCGGDMAFLLPVFRLADNVSFLTGIYGFDITISLDYFTHDVYIKEPLIDPLDLND